MLGVLPGALMEMPEERGTFDVVFVRELLEDVNKCLGVLKQHIADDVPSRSLLGWKVDQLLSSGGRGSTASQRSYGELAPKSCCGESLRASGQRVPLGDRAALISRSQRYHE